MSAPGNTPRTELPGLIAYRACAGVDAIDEYARRLRRALASLGIAASYEAGGLARACEHAAGRPWTLLQYNPFAYGRAGIAPSVVPYALALRRRTEGPLAVMVHEAWIDIDGLRSGLIGGWQRAQLRALLSFADVILTSTEALARELGPRAQHVPVAATITPAAISPPVARESLGLSDRLVVTLLGRGNPSRALADAEAALAAIAALHGAERLTVLNLGADAPPIALPAGAALRTPGHVGSEELSTWLYASDLVLLPFTDGLSTRRTTLMAALAHGLPVVGIRGRNTDRVLADHPQALVLVPAGDRGAYADAAADLAADPARRRAVGDAGRRLYETAFDWPVLARRTAAALGLDVNEQPRAARPEQISDPAPARPAPLPATP